MVREQNSMTGQPRPRTVWVSVRLMVLGVAVTVWTAWAIGVAVRAIPAATTAVRAVMGRMAWMLADVHGGWSSFAPRWGQKSTHPLVRFSLGDGACGQATT